MRRHHARTLLLAPLLLALVACQDPDVGGECHLAWGASTDGKPDAFCGGTDDKEACFSVAADFFETGNIDCENSICIMSPVASGSKYDRAPGTGYCSKACVSNKDCYQSETGLVCRQMVLDPAFIEELQRRDPALLQRYLGDLTHSSYCAVP